jgi:hypothetical protein
MESSNSLARAEGALSQAENIFNQRTQALKTQDLLKEQLEEQKDEEVNKSIEGIADSLGGQLEAKGIDVGKRALSFAKNKLLGTAERTAFRKGQSTAGRFLQDARTKGLGSATKNLGGDLLERGQRQALRMLDGQNTQIANVMSGESDFGQGLNDAMNSWSLNALDDVAPRASSIASNVASKVSNVASQAASRVSDELSGAATKASDAANSIRGAATKAADESMSSTQGLAKSLIQDGSHPFQALTPAMDATSASSAPIRNSALDSAAAKLSDAVRGKPFRTSAPEEEGTELDDVTSDWASQIARSRGPEVEDAVKVARAAANNLDPELDYIRILHQPFNVNMLDKDWAYNKPWNHERMKTSAPEGLQDFLDKNKDLDIGQQLERDVDAEDATDAARGAADAAAETAAGLDDTELARTGMKKIVGDAAGRATQLTGEQAGSLSQAAAKDAQTAAKSAEQTLSNKVGDMGVESATGASQSAEMSAQSAAESEKLAGRVATKMATDPASSAAQGASQRAEQVAQEATQRAQQVTSDVNRAGQSASDAASSAVRDATEAATKASNVADATSLTTGLDDVVSGAQDAAKTATAAATGGVEALEGSVEGGLLAADAVDQEIPGLDVLTDTATAGLGLAMMLGGNIFKSHANATAQAAANKAQEASAAIENMPGIGLEFGNK